MSRFLDRRETIWIAGSIALGLGGIAGAVWTTYGVTCAIAAFAGGSLLPMRELVNKSRRRLRYPSPIEDVGEGLRLSDVHREVTECLQIDIDKGHVRFDVLKAVSISAEMFARLSFAVNEEVVGAVTRINLWAFEGSPYGRPQDDSFAAVKHKRNAGIAKRNPFAFALLRDRRNPDLAIGFTSVLPLTLNGARRYLTSPGVPDNQIAPDMVALAGEPAADCLLFAIGQLKLFRGNKVLTVPGLEPSTKRYRDVDARAAADLLRVVCYQLGVILASMSATSETRVISQSNIPGVQRALRSLMFHEALDIETGDAEKAFALLLMPYHVAEARKHLRARAVLFD